MKAIASSLALLAGLMACGQASESVTDDGNEIRDGKVELAHPAVGMLVFPGATAICTGTLIAPDVVLTAGHCVDEGKIPEAFYIGTGKAVARVSGGEATAEMTRYEVIAGEFIPGYVVTQRCPKDGLDVGLVRLAAPVVGIAPETMSKRAPIADETCTAIGFGKHPLADGGTTRGEKRSAEMVFRSEMHGAFAFDDKTGGTEKGDSGGPVFCKGSVVGVNSCGNRPDRFARLDVAWPWIQAKIADWDAPWTGAEPGNLGPAADAGSNDGGGE